MKKILLAAALMGCAYSFYSCSEDNAHTQYPIESQAPGKVTDVTYEAAPGAVTIKYKTPTDKDLLYVKATYQLDDHTTKEAKASAYSNTLLLEGFGKGDSVRQVSVVAVDVNQNESEPTVVNVVPEASPIYETAKTVSGSETYGGVKIKWTNPKDFNVIIVVNRQNAKGEWEQLNGGKIYAQGTGEEDTRSIQGVDSTEANFSIQVQDRWGNKSESYIFKAKPIFEELIDKSTFVKWVPKAPLSDDDKISNNYYWGYDIPKMWDGLYAATYSGDNCYSTQSGGNQQNKISFNMVSQVQPTRMKIWTRRNYGYSAIFEYVRVWGSNDPEGNPTFDQTAEPESRRWILLTEEQGPDGGYHIYKPSGLSGVQKTSADVQYAEYEGLDIYFKPNAPTVKYICIEDISNWNGGSNKSFTIAEIGVWGKYIKK